MVDRLRTAQMCYMEISLHLADDVYVIQDTQRALEGNILVLN